jgi:nitrite reductase/ring-hydroxylating ferredoxin subunit
MSRMSELAIEEGSTPHSTDFIRVAPLEELKAAGLVVVRGARCPLLVVHDDGKVFALDNRCPHLGFPLHRGSVEDGILTCHWHHARFDLASGCTFDLWADDVPTAAVEIRTVWYGSVRTPVMRTVTPTGATDLTRVGPEHRPRPRQGCAGAYRRERRLSRPCA